jgi:hypothetical protein
MWKAMAIKPIADTPAAVEDVVKALRAVYVNGDARFARFELDAPEHLDFYLRRLNENGFIDRLLGRPEVFALLGKPIASVGPMGYVSPFILAGDIAWALWQGGAYERWRGSADAVVELTTRAARTLLGDWAQSDIELGSNLAPGVPAHPLTYALDTAWAEWHRDIAWDRTWLGADVSSRQVWVLTASDSD